MFSVNHHKSGKKKVSLEKLLELFPNKPWDWENLSTNFDITWKL